jgi:hypothetical protein
MNVNVFFASLFLNLTLCMTKLRVLVLCFSYFMDNSNASGVGEFSKELPTPDGAEGRLIWELPRSEGFTERKNG